MDILRKPDISIRKWQRYYKLICLNTRYTENVVIIGFLDPENIGIDTIIKFLALLTNDRVIILYISLDIRLSAIF